MPFENVHRVTTLNPLVNKGSIDALERDLPVPLPPGYREYVSSLGVGELCDLLRVRSPSEIRGTLADDPYERGGQVSGLRDGWWKPCDLTPEDLEQAVTFADSAEGDQFVVCPRFASRLFELPRHDDTIREYQNGFWDVVDASVRMMEHDFPFFEPFDDKRRRNRIFDVDAAIGLQGLLDAAIARWSLEGIRQSRTSATERYPNLFVRAIHARFVLYLEEDSLKDGWFSVVMTHDVGGESEAAAFVESLAIPGKSWTH